MASKKYKVTSFIEIEDIKEFKKFVKDSGYEWDDFFSDYGEFARGTMQSIINDYGINNIGENWEILDITGTIKVEELKKSK